MIVNGNIPIKVDVDASEAIKIIEDYFGLLEKEPYTSVIILDKHDSYNMSGKKAIFKKIDMSWYGACDDKYELITSDDNKIKIYEALLLLEKTIKNKEKIF